MTVAGCDVYSHANPVFVREIMARGGTSVVLDVGCWNGTLGRVLIQGGGVIVDGIERDSRQAALAKANGYRKVLVADLDGDLGKVGGETYDFVLFGDVLEHLIDPLRVLTQLARCAKPGGQILVSLPNIAFVANRISHLRGNWNYKDYGILDRTHLRFFTKATMVGLLKEAGLRVTKVEGYVGLGNYPWIVRKTLRTLGRAWPSLFAIQIVLIAERA